jgi:hypothetical protein
MKMNTYMIERELPGAGQLTADELHTIATKSNQVIAEDCQHTVQWVTSYITGDKLYCVYRAGDAEALREHARCGGFPADEVVEIVGRFDPTTGD